MHQVNGWVVRAKAPGEAKSLVAESPGEVFMMDYIDMGEESGGYRYVLMGVDKFSRLVEFKATAGPMAIEATKGTLQWGARYYRSTAYPTGSIQTGAATSRTKQCSY